MSPRFSIDDEADECAGNAISRSESFLTNIASSISRAYFSDALLVEFSLMVPFAAHPVHPTLVAAINGVISWRSGKEMVRSKAMCVVAFMANVVAFWNNAACEFKGHAMHDMRPLSNAKRAISMPIVTAWPLHAGIVFGHGFQKFLQQFKVANLMSHRRALHGAWCMAPAVLMHRGAFSIFA